MALNRSALNRNSSAQILGKMKEAFKPKKNNYDDERVWKPSRNEEGVGFAILRLLPPPVEDGSYVRESFSHGFKGVGGWYINSCPTTIGKKCPVCDHNTVLWNSGIETDKNTARQHARRTSYLTNVLVVKDSVHPENEGKVFIWGMGKKLFEKAKAVINPPAEFEEEGRNPWDLFSGIELRLKCKTVGDFPNYDASTFETSSVLFDGDEEKLEDLLRKTYDLDKYVEEQQMEYGELSRKFAKVIGVGGDDVEEGGEDFGEAPVADHKVTEKKAPKMTSAPKEEASDDEGEDLMSYFKNLRDGAGEKVPF